MCFIFLYYEFYHVNESTSPCLLETSRTDCSAFCARSILCDPGEMVPLIHVTFRLTSLASSRAHSTKVRKRAMGSAVSISAAEIAAGIGSTILAVQLLTPADPIGKTWQLIRQFRKQVRRPQERGGDGSARLKKGIVRDQHGT